LLPHAEFSELANASDDNDEDVRGEWATGLKASSS